MGPDPWLAVLATGLSFVGCSTHEDCPGAGGCPTHAAVTFELSCNPNDLVSVTATGPCAHPDASLSWYRDATECCIVVPAATAGTCHVVLTFATGFTYTQDVTFQDVQGDSCCPSYVWPTSGSFMVNNPPDTCVAPPTSTDAGE